MGVEIHLHCFDYGRGPAKELERYCASVHYYERRTGLRAVCSKRPYIVESRENEELINRLQSDNIPILLEGLHCCSVLEALSERGNREVFVRAHNVEHDYYMGLAHAERRLWKRFYLYSDALKLRRYEQVLQRASAVFAITEADAKHYEQYG